MRIFFNSNSKKSVIALGLLVGLVVSLAWPARSVAQPLPCSWPIEVIGHGVTNVAYPDTDATYWVMPIDTAIWKTMIVRGEYPQSRFFSFVTYLRDGNVMDSIIDADIAPDPGSTNPFTPGGDSEHQNYTVVIGDDLLGSTNHLKLVNTTLAFVVYRVYVPDQGLNRKGGVPLPQLTLVSADGVAQRFRSCRFLEPVEAERSLALSLDALALAGKDILSSQLEILTNSAANPCQSNQEIVITFAKNPEGGRFSNPANTYLTAGGLCPQPNKIIVIRGKGAVFPDTHNGRSIFQPAIPGDIQVRYWSMCNNDQQFPFPVVACQPDWATKLDEEGFYTYVVSQDQSTPSWVPPDATWLPWGNPNIPNVLYFREMLPASGLDLAGDYRPQGLFCDKDLFVAQGWQGCFAAAAAEVH